MSTESMDTSADGLSNARSTLIERSQRRAGTQSSSSVIGYQGRFEQVAYDGSPWPVDAYGNGYQGGRISGPAFRWMGEYCQQQFGVLDTRCQWQLIPENRDLAGLSPDAIRDMADLVRRVCRREADDCSDRLLSAWRQSQLDGSRPKFSPDKMYEDRPTEFEFKLVVPTRAEQESGTYAQTTVEPGDSATATTQIKPLIPYSPTEMCFALSYAKLEKPPIPSRT